MKKPCLLVALATALFAVVTSAASGLGYLKVHPVNPHYFQENGTGRPILVATVSGIVPEYMGYDDIAGINQTILRRRLSYARVWHIGGWSDPGNIEPWAFSNQTGACNGIPYKFDLNTWNPVYWTRMSNSLSLANSGGVYAEMMVFDRCQISPSDPDRWGNIPWALENNINNLEVPSCGGDGAPAFYDWANKPNLRYHQERWVKKLIDETIQFPNVFYEVENEHWKSNSAGWADHYGQFIKDYIAAHYPNTPRLISYSAIISDADLDQCYTMPAIDVVNNHFGKALQSDPSLANSYIEPRWSYNKPINIDEFANNVTDPNILRQECWTIITSGGHFHIEDASDAARPADISENVRSFIALSGWNFIGSSPDRALVADGAGYCMKNPGVEYVCYFPTGGSKTVSIAPGTYRQEWWNPSTGGFYNVSAFTHGGGSKSFTCPDANDWVLHIAVAAAPTTVLTSKPVSGAITIDGNTGDWNLGEFTTKIRGGSTGTGDTGIVEFDPPLPPPYQGGEGGVCYVGGHYDGWQVLPLSAADHAARVYSRHDASYLYFLVRCDDNDIRYPNGAGSNPSNDCVHFFIDPGHDHGSSAMSNSTSDVDLVIDANNQRNVYSTTVGYQTQVLAGVASAVVRDSTYAPSGRSGPAQSAAGWWLEARISKTALSPAVPATGAIGVDFAFRDNDNSTSLDTVTSWRDPEVSTSFPTKIPMRWGDLLLLGAGDATPPGPATSFVASPGAGQVSLSWQNPTDADFTGTMIRYKTTGFPTSTTDGTLLIDKSGTPSGTESYVHTGLTNGMTYYYSVFAHDGVPNYAPGAYANATLSLPGVCFSDSFSYANGSLSGNGGWTGTCSSIAVTGGTVQITGGSPGCGTGRAVSCLGSGGKIHVRVQVRGTSGNQNMWSLYIDDPAGANLARWYGNAMSARPRIDGSNTLVLKPATLTGGWDTLDVNIDTNTKIDEFFFNGVSLGTLNYSWSGAGSVVGGVRFERIDNGAANGNIIYFDNLTVGNVDMPPGPVTGFNAVQGNERNFLMWNNPPDADLAGVKVLFKSAGYPSSPTDGTVVYQGVGTSCSHTGLANGQVCYYAAYAYDQLPNYSTAAHASAAPIYFGPVQAKMCADGTLLTMTVGTVSAVLGDSFYVQCVAEPVEGATCGPCGIKVVDSGGDMQVGQSATVKGTITTDPATGERYISATWANGN